MLSTVYTHISQSYIHSFGRSGVEIRGVWVSDNVSQAFLDKVGHQDLRSLLVLHQNIMRSRYLVSVKAVQQCYTNYSRCGVKRKKKDIYHIRYLSYSIMFKMSLLLMLEIIGSKLAKSVEARHSLFPPLLSLMTNI